MDSRSRVLAAMRGEEVDRVPAALGFYPVSLESLLPDISVYQGVLDVRFVQFPISSAERELRKLAQPYRGDTRLGSIDQVGNYDRWGFRPEDPINRNPLANAATFKDLSSFPFPETSFPYRPKALPRSVQRLRDHGYCVGGNLPHLGGELFEAAWRLRGLQNFLMDMVRRPDWADYLLDRLTELACRNASALANAGVDVLALDDDVGMPETMFISPDTWRRFFKCRLARIIQAARSENPELAVLYHSDGTIYPIIEDLMEIGVDAINPVQPDHMDPKVLRQRFGNHLTLWGTVGRHTTFSHGSPESILKEIQFRLKSLGRRALVLSPAYDIDEPDIPTENLQAFFEGIREYG